MSPTKPVVLIVDPDEQNASAVCQVVLRLDFEPIYLSSLDELSKVVNKAGMAAILINIDTLSINNHFFFNLKKDNPTLLILGFSQRLWHPELAIALGSSIFACIRYPIDPDELSYCFKGLVASEQAQKTGFDLPLGVEKKNKEVV